MSSLHYNKVVFARDYKEIFTAVHKPLFWPALRYHVAELYQLLRGIADYQLLSVWKEENRGAVIIAQNVTKPTPLMCHLLCGGTCLCIVFV